MSAFGKDYSGRKSLSVLKRRLLVDGMPIVVDLAKSKGAYLYNQLDKKTYLDFYSFFASLAIGFTHPGLKKKSYLKALHEAAGVKPALSDIYSPHFAHFVDIFDKICLRGMFRYLFFIEGGALAVENALKVAFDWKSRLNLKHGSKTEANQVIHFSQCFHGRSGYTLSMTDTFDKRKTDYFPKFPWPRVLNPKIHVYEEDALPPTLEGRERTALSQIEAHLNQFGAETAAIIIEPVQSEGGGNYFRPEFFRALRRVADDRDVLLIFDEVQTGMGISGKWWCWEHYGVKPDLMAFGKKAQVSGIAVTDRIDREKIDHCFKIPSRINSTFGGNLCDMVRATRYIEIIQEENLLKNMAASGKQILKALEKLAEKYPMANVRGLGGLIAFDVPTVEIRNRIVKTALEKERLLILPSGKRSVRLRPTLSITKKEAEDGIARLDKTLWRIFSNG
ncbi:MAG: L-lysine 6-transaminase [Deltaproteobacteria bacterium]|nr:L-lysine 6-transaminase [Deltaproteobacteria bacterium]